MGSDSLPRTPQEAGRKLRTSLPFRMTMRFLVGLVLLWAMGAAVMSTPWFRRALERRVVRGIEELSGTRAEVRAFHFNPLILQLRLEGLTLHGREQGDAPPLFYSPHVRMSFHPLSFARRRLRLRSLECEGAEIGLSARPDGSTNLPGPLATLRPDQAVGELLNLSISDFVFSRSQVHWKDHRWPIDIEAKEMAFLVRRQSPNRYAGSLSASQLRIGPAGAPVAPVNIATSFQVSPEGLVASPLTWKSKGFTGECSVESPALAAFRISFTCRSEGELSELGKLIPLPAMGSGKVAIRARGSYQSGQLKVQGEIAGRELRVLSRELNLERVDFSGAYTLDETRVQVPSFQVSALGGTARGEAKFSFEPRRFRMRAQLRGIDLATALRAFPAGQPMLSRLRFAGRAEGSIDADWPNPQNLLIARFHVEVQPPPEGATGIVPVEGRASGKVKLGHTPALELSELNIKTPQSTLTAGGASGGTASNVSFRLTTSSFEEWRPAVEYFWRLSAPLTVTLRSPATLTGNVSGSISRPTIRASLRTQAFLYRDRAWDAFEGNLAVSREQFELSAARLRRGASAITASLSAGLAAWSLTPDSPIHFSVEAQRTPIAGLAAALGLDYPIQGLTTGELELSGRWGQLSGRGRIQIDGGSFFRETFDSMTANLVASESRWDVEDISLRKGPGLLTGKVAFQPPTRSFTGELRGSNFSLAEFKSIAPARAGKTSGMGIEGLIGIDLRGQGTLDSLRLQSKWNIHSLRVGGNEVGDLEGQFDCVGRDLRLEGEGSGPGGQFHFGGQTRREAAWPSHLVGGFENFRADPWIHYLLGGKFKTPITATGSFTLSGPLKEPDKLQAQSQVTDLEFQFPSMTWKNEAPVSLSFGSRVLTASKVRMQGPSTHLEVSGSVRLGEPATLSLDVQGTSEAALLGLIDPGIQASGRSELQVHVGGTPAQPSLNGQLNVHDVSLSYGDLPFHITGLSGEIHLEGERATLRALQGSGGGGKVTLGGSVVLAGMTRFDIRADLDQVRVPYPRDLTSVLSGNLRLIGTPERAELGGELLVRQMFVSENFDLLTRMIEGASPMTSPLPGVASPIAAKVRLNIPVTSTPTVRLETREWSLVADLDLRLQGTLANPVETGSIHLHNGEAVFRGNRYRLARGEVRMSNPIRTQPVLDLEAATRVERYSLTVDISGPTDKLKLAYRSDPPLPIADILSLLALGYSREQTEMSTMAPRGALPTVGASALLSQALSTQAMGRAQRLFGVSRIRIDPNVGGPGTPGGARITVEQQVTRDFSLTYVTNTASSQYRVVQFEWAVTENTSLLGVRDQNGIFGVEIKFHHRFK